MAIAAAAAISPILTDRNEPIAQRVRNSVLLGRDVLCGLRVGSINVLDEFGRLPLMRLTPIEADARVVWPSWLWLCSTPSVPSAISFGSHGSCSPYRAAAWPGGGPHGGACRPRYWDVRIAVVIGAAPGAPAHAIEPSIKEHFSSSARQSNGHQRAPAAREGCVAKQTKFYDCFL